MESAVAYKNADAFAAAHGENKECSNGEDISVMDIAKDVADMAVEEAKERFEDWLDPREKDPVKIEARRRWDEEDLKRPDIVSLKFTPIPKEKAKGLKAKFGLFAGDWNKFIKEIEAGKTEIAEVLYLDFYDIKCADNVIDQELYCKIADLEGHVIKGTVRKVTNTGGYYAGDIGGWMSPYEYGMKYPSRADEEYEEYYELYWKINQQDPVDPSDRKHAYVIHYYKGKHEYYGLITMDEYDDLKKIKDRVSSYSPEYSLKTSNNMTPEWSW